MDLETEAFSSSQANVKIQVFSMQNHSSAVPNRMVTTAFRDEPRAHAYRRMAEHAAQVGAHAMAGVRYDATEIIPGVTEIPCFGTVVIVKPAR
jgi:uncharacterized protein YbjQ (UPF0145 family)